MKWFRLIVIVLLATVLMSGCIPKLKNPLEITPPSWMVSVKAPLINKNVPLGEFFQDSLGKTEGITVDNNGLYNFTFENNDMNVPMPDLSTLDVGAFSLDAYTWTQGAISVNSGISGVNFNYDLSPFTIPDVYITPDPSNPINTNFSSTGAYITTPFTRVKLSNSAINRIQFTLTTDEPVDSLKIALTDKVGQPIGTPIIFSIPVPNNEVSIPLTTQTKYIDLAGAVLPAEMDFQVEIVAHSTSGSIGLSMSLGDIEIVELEGFNPAAVGMNLPAIEIPNISPLASLPGISEITFKSGKLRISQDTSSSCQDNPFPFLIQIQEFRIDNVNLVKTDADGSYIDLTGVTLSSTSTISGKVGVNFADPLIYDVWNDAQNALQGYVYEVGFAMEDVVPAAIVGDIRELVPDPNPETPEWDLKLDAINSEIQEVNYPEEIQDFNIGIADIFLVLGLKNNTSFQGAFTFTLNSHPDALSAPTNSASFTLNITPRSDIVFDFSKQTDYQKFKEIINSKPQFVSFGVEGSFTVGADFSITQEDSISPSVALNVPIAFSVAPGGATITNVMQQTVNLGQQELDAIKMVDDFVETASLHIKYNNASTLGFGAKFHFTGAGMTKTIDAILYDNRASEIVLTVDNELLAILGDPLGFTVAADLLIPNDNADWRTMALNANANLDLTVWFDGKVLAHVPTQP